MASTINKGKGGNFAGCTTKNPMSISVVTFMVFLIMIGSYINQLQLENKVNKSLGRFSEEVILPFVIHLHIQLQVNFVPQIW